MKEMLRDALVDVLNADTKALRGMTIDEQLNALEMVQAREIQSIA